jgi:hypothetical protein
MKFYRIQAYSKSREDWINIDCHYDLDRALELFEAEKEINTLPLRLVEITERVIKQNEKTNSLE